MINKNLMFSWMQGWDKFPEKFRANVQSVIDKNSDWTPYFWDDKSIRKELLESGQEYLDKYNSLGVLHRQIDYSRFFLLWKYGGASIDTDIVALKGFDELPNINTSDLIVSEKPHSKSMNNATILASANNKILKYLIDNIDTTPCKEGETNYKCIQRTTGPYAFNKILQPYKDQINVLDKVYMEPCASLDSFCKIDPNLSVLDHRHELSWLKQWHKNVIKSYFVAKHYKYQILIAIIILIAIVLIFKRSNN